MRCGDGSQRWMRVELEVLAVDGAIAMHLRGIGEDAARAVAHHGVVLPAAFPELVDDLHVFVGDVVAVVMRGLAVHADAPRAALSR